MTDLDVDDLYEKVLSAVRKHWDQKYIIKKHFYKQCQSLIHNTIIHNTELVISSFYQSNRNMNLLNLTRQMKYHNNISLLMIHIKIIKYFLFRGEKLQGMGK